MKHHMNLWSPKFLKSPTLGNHKLDILKNIFDEVAHMYNSYTSK